MMMCSLCTTSTSELTFIKDHFKAFCASWLAQDVRTTQACKSSKARADLLATNDRNLVVEGVALQLLSLQR